MNLWENEKELIALGQEIRELKKSEEELVSKIDELEQQVRDIYDRYKEECLTEDEKKLVIGLLADANYLRYLNEAELKLLAKLKDEDVWQRGEK